MCSCFSCSLTSSTAAGASRSHRVACVASTRPAGTSGSGAKARRTCACACACAKAWACAYVAHACMDMRVHMGMRDERELVHTAEALLAPVTTKSARRAALSVGSVSVTRADGGFGESPIGATHLCATRRRRRSERRARATDHSDISQRHGPGLIEEQAAIRSHHSQSPFTGTVHRNRSQEPSSRAHSGLSRGRGGSPELIAGHQEGGEVRPSLHTEGSRHSAARAQGRAMRYGRRGPFPARPHLAAAALRQPCRSHRATW